MVFFILLIKIVKFLVNDKIIHINDLHLFHHINIIYIQCFRTNSWVIIDNQDTLNVKTLIPTTCSRINWLMLRLQNLLIRLLIWHKIPRWFVQILLFWVKILVAFHKAQSSKYMNKRNQEISLLTVIIPWTATIIIPK